MPQPHRPTSRPHSVPEPLSTDETKQPTAEQQEITGEQHATVGRVEPGAQPARPMTTLADWYRQAHKGPGPPITVLDEISRLERRRKRAKPGKSRPRNARRPR